MDRETCYSSDEQRVADWLINRTSGIVGAGDDPIGVLIASYELMHDQYAKHKQLHDLCEQFMILNQVTCAETVYQTDHAHALVLIKRMCDVVGYVQEAES